MVTRFSGIPARPTRPRHDRRKPAGGCAESWR